MQNLRTFARRAATTARAAVLSVAAPHRLFTETPAPAAAPVEAPATGLYEPDEIPDAEIIDAAAKAFDQAADQARRSDRAKRAARKILDRLPVGRYGAWEIERVPSGRETVDLNAVRAAYKAAGLGPVPMKTAAPSLRVKRVAVQVLAPVADNTAAVA